MSKKNNKSKSNNSIAKIVKKELRKSSETKHQSWVSGAFDYIGDGISSRTTLVNMTALQVGIQDYQRVGNKISLQKLNLSKVMRIVQSQTAKNQAVRLLIVQSRGGELGVSDMPDYWAPVNVQKMLVLKDKFYTLSSGGSDYASGNTNNAYLIRINFKITRKNIPHPILIYKNTSSDPNSVICDRPIYLYIVCESVAQVEQAGFEQTYYKDY